MRVQDFIADQTAFCCEGLIRQAEALPADKVTWQPEGARSALDQVAECAIICGHMPATLTAKTMPDFTPEMIAEFEATKAQLDTLEKAAAALRTANAALVDYIRGMADADLEGQMKFWGPEPWRVADVADYHRWNMVYHTGQICYMQTLLGDKDMH
ncbi:MAG: DinB family protein [Chthonomonas sp.]|nr:DinB family protein [Chthonomonas sp.]